MGYSNIPSCDKWAAYGSYPRSNDLENHDQKATPGPSCPYNSGMIIRIMIMIMTVAIVILIRLFSTNGGRIMILMTQMILHPLMTHIGHHAQVEMKYMTCTHPLKQRIGIDTGVSPIVVIRPSLITTGITMGVMPMTMVVTAPLTRQAHRVIEVGEMRGIEAKMTIGHPSATHAPRFT